VQVWKKDLRGPGTMLAERRTLANGFFDVPYSPPANSTNGTKAAVHLEVRVLAPDNTPIETRALFNPTLVAWANFTEGSEPYRGPSEYEARIAAILPLLGIATLADIVETDDRREVTQLSQSTGLPLDEVMRLVLAHRGAAADATLTAPVIYAFLRQNLPPSLPSELLASTDGWTLIDQLVDRVVRGIVFMDPDLQAQAFDSAVKENLIPIAVGKDRTAILAALAALGPRFALEQPMLVGNGRLKTLLEASSVPADKFGAVASAFLTHRGIGDDFWSDLRSRASEFGGDQAVADFQTTVDVGHIAKKTWRSSRGTSGQR